MEKPVSTSQNLEYDIFSIILDEIEKVIDGGNPNQSRKNIKIGIERSVKKRLKEIEDETGELLKINAKQTLNEFKKGKKPPVNFSRIKKDTFKNYEKYIKTKGTNFIIDNKGISQFFTNFINQEVQEVVMGTEDINIIIRKAIHKLADSGLSVIDYESGIKRNIDVFVRQEILYAQKKSTQDIRDKFAKENGITIFEFDAHPNARPTHQLWQGKRYDITGKEYPTLEQLTHGEHNDYGCKHRAFPVWFKEDKYMFTKKQLEDINTKPFEWRGKEVDGYKGTQLMREYERKMRAINREKSLLKKKGMEIPDELNYKFSRLDKEYSQLCKKMKTYKRKDRIEVVY